MSKGSEKEIVERIKTRISGQIDFFFENSAVNSVITKNTT